MMEQKACYECECKYRCRRKARKCCIDTIIFILSTLLALTIGLIIGSIPIIGVILLLALPALIILAILLLLAIILRAIDKRCNKCKKYEDKC